MWQRSVLNDTAVLCALLVLLCTFGHSQQRKASQRKNESEPRFLGAWKLNSQRTPKFPPGLFNPLPIYDSITIERQGSNYKLLLKGSRQGLRADAAIENQGYISDMKGSEVNPNDTIDALATNLRFQQRTLYRFVESTTVSNIDFSVSEDGRTMTVRQSVYMDNASDRTLVYDRVP